MRGDAGDLDRDPASFAAVGPNVYACGRDAFFPAWPDVLQLDAFSDGLRAAAIATLHDIALQCDAVRCDMAMLMLDDVFARTWSGRVAQPRATGYWRDLIPAVRARHPDFRFIAEAYWDLEWELQQQGFDWCYDKRLYDRLEHGDAEAVRQHLCADSGYQHKLLRFLENHDEPRAAAAFQGAKERACAVLALTQCGARLAHEGQLEGRRVRLPVFLARRPPEAVDADLRTFHGALLAATRNRAFHEGEWRLCERSGWPDNASFRQVVAWCWRHGDERFVVVVNLSGRPAQAQVQLPWQELAGRAWRLEDLLSGDSYDRDGDEMQRPGLYVELGGWGAHLLRLR